jgi:hypothetical protein
MADAFEFDEVISEPFLTEDGFLNPACMNALGAAIDRSPPPYERFAGNAEWVKPRWIFYHHITAALAKWAIRQSPYHMPEHLMEVIGYLDACLRRDVKWNVLGMAELSLCQISKLLHDILMDRGVTYFDAWNVPKKGPHETKFTSAYDGPQDPDYDFIDLHALLHNVCLDIRNEHRASDAFDVKFEKEWAESHPEESRV